MNPSEIRRDSREDRDMTIDASRIHQLEGAANFRDLGGLPTTDGQTVRRGRIFRSDVLYRLTENDMTVLDPLGIRTVIDLRSHDEVRKYGESRLKAAGLQHFNVPIVDVELDPTIEASLVDQYVALLRNVADGFRSIFGHLASDHYPLVINCFAGKDRTGITSALILGSLGVPDHEIVADYALSGQNMLRLLQLHPQPGIDLADIPPSWLVADAATMELFLAAIEAEWGSVRGYLTAIGVTDDELHRIATTLLEPTNANS
jgi:protein-tyrosine phosphatase